MKYKWKYADGKGLTAHLISEGMANGHLIRAEVEEADETRAMVSVTVDGKKYRESIVPGGYKKWMAKAEKWITDAIRRSNT